MLVRTSQRSPAHFPTAKTRRLGACSDSACFGFRASVAIVAPFSREAEHTLVAVVVRANGAPGQQQTCHCTCSRKRLI